MNQSADHLAKQTMSFFFQQYDWIINLSLSVLLGVVVSIILLIFYKKYLPKAQRKKQYWIEIFLSALYGPLFFYTWFIVASLILQVFVHQLGLNGEFVSVASMVRRVLTLLFLFWFAMRFVRVWEQKYSAALEAGHKKSKAFKDSTSISAIAQLCRVVALVIISLMLLSALGIPISTLLAFGGIGGLAISFAAKDTLANFIGGLMVYWDRPFSVGDWVSSPDRNIEGTVLNIGWRLTCIRTFDKRPIYVPNSVFSNVVVENPSRMLNRRIKVVIGIRYDDAAKVKTIIEEIKQMVEGHSEIDTGQTCFVNLVEFGASSLNILIYAFTKTTNWLKFQSVQQDVFMQIIDIVGKQGAEFAFPTRTVHIPQGLELQQKRQGDDNDGPANLQ